MQQNGETRTPLFAQLPESLQNKILDLFNENNFVQAKKLYQEYINSFAANMLLEAAEHK